MVLLDTHVVLVALGQSDIILPPAMKMRLTQQGEVFASVATLWELAIKHRLGKLGLSIKLMGVPDILRDLNIEILPVQAAHALADIGLELRTKDPFDRLLLGVCAIEGFKLATLDRTMVDHPLAWRPFPL